MVKGLQQGIHFHNVNLITLPGSIPLFRAISAAPPRATPQCPTVTKKIQGAVRFLKMFCTADQLHLLGVAAASGKFGSRLSEETPCLVINNKTVATKNVQDVGTQTEKVDCAAEHSSRKDTLIDSEEDDSNLDSPTAVRDPEVLDESSPAVAPEQDQCFPAGVLVPAFPIDFCDVCFRFNGVEINIHQCYCVGNTYSS